MNYSEYWQLVADTAQEFIDSDPVNSPTRPSTAFNERLDGLVDRNWSDEDAFACLQFSHHPSAEQFNTGGYKPASQKEPFPFKTFALPALAEDVKARLAEAGFDLNEIEGGWEDDREEDDHAE